MRYLVSVAPKGEHKEDVNIFRICWLAVFFAAKCSVFPLCIIMYARVRVCEFTKFNLATLGYEQPKTNFAGYFGLFPWIHAPYFEIFAFFGQMVGF